MPTQGTTWIDVRAKLDSLARDLKTAEAMSATAGTKAGDQMAKSMSQKLTGLGRNLSRTLSPAAAAIGLLAYQAFSAWDEGLDAIRSGTGATGKALLRLEQSMKNVASNVTQGLGEVGKAIAEVHKRTGLTGPALETLTKQILDLNGRLNNEASVETVTRVFGDWSIATENQSAALDTLYRASQATGPSIDQLGQLIVRYGAPLRQLGFGFEESAVMMGKFEKEGVNTQLVLGGLRMALGKMAEEGVDDPAQALETLIQRIKDAGSTGKANAIALEMFGRRAGPDMAAAVREGRFELTKLIDQVANGKETTESAADATLDWSDKIAMLRNSVQGFIGPSGQVIAGLATFATAAGPAIFGAGKLVEAYQKLKTSADAANKSTLAYASGGLAKSAATYAGPVALAMATWSFATRGQSVASGVLADAMDRTVGAAAKEEKQIEKTARAHGATTVAVRLHRKALTLFAETAEDLRAWRVDVVKDLGTSNKAFERLADKAKISAKDIEKALERMIDAQGKFRHDWRDVARVAGKETDDLINFIAERMGVDAPKATKVLADASNKDVRAILKDYQKWRDEAATTEGALGTAMAGVRDDISSTGSAAKTSADKVRDLNGSLHTLAGISDVKVNISGPQGDGFGALGAGGGSAAAIARAAAAAVPGAQGISGYRDPISNAAAGGAQNSYHMDPVNPAQDISGANLLAVFNWIASRYGGGLRELIYTPAGYSILNGQRVPPYAQADHYDHVHVADFGARIKGPALVRIGNITEDVTFTPRTGPGLVRGGDGGSGDVHIHNHYHGSFVAGGRAGVNELASNLEGAVRERGVLMPGRR